MCATTTRQGKAKLKKNLHAGRKWSSFLLRLIAGERMEPGGVDLYTLAWSKYTSALVRAQVETRKGAETNRRNHLSQSYFSKSFDLHNTVFVHFQVICSMLSAEGAAAPGTATKTVGSARGNRTGSSNDILLLCAAPNQEGRILIPRVRSLLSNKRYMPPDYQEQRTEDWRKACLLHLHRPHTLSEGFSTEARIKSRVECPAYILLIKDLQGYFPISRSILSSLRVQTQGIHVSLHLVISRMNICTLHASQCLQTLQKSFSALSWAVLAYVLAGSAISF